MKRKKYSEELEARLSDEEVKVIVKAKKTSAAVRKEPAVQLFVVSRCEPTIKKEVCGLWTGASAQRGGPAVWKRERAPYSGFWIVFPILGNCILLCIYPISPGLKAIAAGFICQTSVCVGL